MMDSKKRKINLGILFLTLLMLLVSCGTTRVETKPTTHNCELMEQGKKCLLDHSCCDVYKNRGF